MRKPKFKPEITRVKLNPEQAVLTCSCYNGTYAAGAPGYYSEPGLAIACVFGEKTTIETCYSDTASGSYTVNSDTTSASS